MVQNLNLPLYEIESLLPHARPMILLDKVVDRLPDGIVTELQIRPDAPFFQQGRGIPAHIALEWMAQTCGAHVGAMAMESGAPVRIGLLLGTRDFNCRVDWFTPEQKVLITAKLIYHEGETAVFDCWANLGEEIVAMAKLTVYQPSDMADMMAMQRIGSRE
jgi:predicted hotdog family 3-hydroxylacyl-ACP dehydratase